MERVYVNDLRVGCEYLIYIDWTVNGERVRDRTVVRGWAWNYRHTYDYTLITFAVEDEFTGDCRMITTNAMNPMYCIPDRMPPDLKSAILQRQQLMTNPKQTRDTKNEIIYHPICVFANPSDYFSSDTIVHYKLC
jgi:hypothetical protein